MYPSMGIGQQLEKIRKCNRKGKNQQENFRLFTHQQLDEVRQTPTNHPRKSIINLKGFREFVVNQRRSFNDFRQRLKNI